MTTLTDLGLVGLVLIAGGVVFVGYWATRAFRPQAIWYEDLARGCAWLRTHRPQLPALHVVHPWWPRAVTGPRMWRWPLNTTRAFTLGLYGLIVPARGLLGLILRLAWHWSAGIGAAAAISLALVLMALFTLPAAVVWFVVDSVTVIRGGIAPPRPAHAKKAAARHYRHTVEAEHRLAQIRHQLTQPVGTVAR